MEDLEAEAINTTPTHSKPTLRKRYVDDILEKRKPRHTQELTDHVNSIFTTGKMQLPHEEETSRTISFVAMNTHMSQFTGNPRHTDQDRWWILEHPSQRL